MSAGAQLHLADMWRRPLMRMDDDELRPHLSWADMATTTAVGSIVERRLVVRRANGLMPIVMDVAGMPMADGDEIRAFNRSMDMLSMWIADPTGYARAVGASRAHAKAAATIIACERPDSIIVWAQAPTRDSALCGAALEQIAWAYFEQEWITYGSDAWKNACPIAPMHEVIGIADAASAHLRIHPVVSRLDRDAVVSATADPMERLRAHALLNGGAAA